MYLKDGILVNGTPPRQGSKKKNPRVITHWSQRTAVAPSSRRLDALLKGEARIMIFRNLGGLGDIIMATPIARGIKRKYPNSHLTYAVPADYANGDLVALLENIPYIDEIVDYKLINRDDYDSFTNITRTGLSEERPHSVPLNRIDLFAQKAGVPLFGDHRPIYIITEDEKMWAEEFVKKNTPEGAKGIIAVHTRSNDPRRTWPAQHLREFLHLAKQKGYHSYLFGWGDNDKEWGLAGVTQVFDYKIRQAAAVMSLCDILVCPDSVLLHLGGALNMKIVSLFGSIPPACRINHYPNATAVVSTQVPCLGCFYGDCANNYYCMSSIFPKIVLAEVEKKLKEEKVQEVEELEDKSLYAEDSFKKPVNTFRI